MSTHYSINRRMLSLLAVMTLLISATAFGVRAHAAQASIADQIAALQAQIASLTAGTATTSTSSVTFAADLSVGSKGKDVTSLQQWLIAQGFSIPAGATGSFGGQTKAAVLAWQKSAGITPATGYFGPKSRAAAGHSSAASAPSAPLALSGSGGYLTSLTQLGDVEPVLVSGDDDTKVAGVSARAVASDLQIERVDVQFNLSSSTGSSELSKYVDTISIYQDGTKLATLNAADGSYQNKVWTYRFSNLAGIIRKGATSSLYVEVAPVAALHGEDTDQNVIVTIPANAIRAVDSLGVSGSYDAIARSNTFRVNDGTLGTLTLTEASNDPHASVIKADTNNPTTNVTLLSFNGKTKYEGTLIKTVPIELTVTGTSNVSDIVQSVTLMRGSTVLSTKTISGTGTTAEVDFDSLSEPIDQDATQTYTVVATIRKIGTGSSGTLFDSGDTLQASVLGTDPWDATDDTGYETSMQGTVTAGILTFQQTGITTTQANATATKSVGTTLGSGDTTQYGISFKVTAADDDLYISRNIQRLAPGTAPSASNGGVAWATTTSSTAGVTNTGSANLSALDSNSADAAGYYKVPAGSSRTFTLNVSLTATATGYTGVQLVGINWATTTAITTQYFTSGLDQFKTTDISMTTH